MFAMIICMMLNSIVVDVDKIDGGIQFKLHPNVFSDDSYVCVEYDASSDEYSIVEMKTNVDFVM